MYADSGQVFLRASGGFWTAEALKANRIPMPRELRFPSAARSHFAPSVARRHLMPSAARSYQRRQQRAGTLRAPWPRSHPATHVLFFAGAADSRRQFRTKAAVRIENTHNKTRPKASRVHGSRANRYCCCRGARRVGPPPLEAAASRRADPAPSQPFA